VLLEIDVGGAEQIHTVDPSGLFVFVDAPSRDEQAERMRGRGDPEEKIAKRLAKADEEAERARALGMRLVVNDDVENAVEEIERLIADARR
jgi:guanylate kinase